MVSNSTTLLLFLCKWVGEWSWLDIMIGIYKIQNKKNQKVYIGKSINIEKRWKTHQIFLNNNKHQNQHLQNAWNKYGADNFEFSVLYECSEDQLNEAEKKYISQYNSMDVEYGYNLREGGDGGGYAFSTIEKIRGQGSNLSLDDVRHIKIFMYLLMDRKEIANIFNISQKALTQISIGRSFGYVYPFLNDQIHNLKQTLINERNQYILDLYDNGMRICDIKECTGYSISIVEKAVYKYRGKKDKLDQIEKYNMIFELHKKGINNYQISKIVHVSPSTVERYLSGEQSPLRISSTKKVTKEIYKQIIDLYVCQGYSSTKIGDMLNLSKTTVMNVVHNYNNLLSA